MTATGTLEVTSLAPSPTYEHSIQAHQIPYVIEQLGVHGKDDSWIVFIFDTSINSPLTDDPWLNLQYSVINGVVESPRELRRLHYLREWSHEQDE